jgi:hypothetical protein
MCDLCNLYAIEAGEISARNDANSLINSELLPMSPVIFVTLRIAFNYLNRNIQYFERSPWRLQVLKSYLSSNSRMMRRWFQWDLLLQQPHEQQPLFVPRAPASVSIQFQVESSTTFQFRNSDIDGESRCVFELAN